MNKGTRITIVIESIDMQGVVTEATKPARVKCISGDNVTVQDNHGHIYEIDANTRNRRGEYVVLS